MPIPTALEIMMPFLRLIQDGKEYHRTGIREQLAGVLAITDQERNEMLPSGIRPKFNDRVSWANTLLGKAGLIERTRRGHFKISPAGMELLARGLAQVDRKLLLSLPGIKQWRSEYLGAREEKVGHGPESEIDAPAYSPEEMVASSMHQIRESLQQVLIDQVKACSPRFFERLVVDLLVRMGYGGTLPEAGQVIGKSGDGGIDGLIKEDKLGLDAIYVQAKRWEGVVGRPVVQAFAGSLEGHRAKKGVMITTSKFSDDAKGYVRMIEKKIVLIDGYELAQLMIDHDVGVTPVTSYTIKRIDSDYFDEE